MEEAIGGLAVDISPGQFFRKKVSLPMLLAYRLILSMLSNAPDNPMTCGFVCENRMILTNRGHFGALRQKLGNDRALTMAGDFENSRAELKSESDPVMLRKDMESR